jgi:O-antigen ligase
MNKIRINLLTILVFLIPYQTWQPFNSIYLNATFFAFFLYFFASLVDWQKNFKLAFAKTYLIPLSILWALMLIMTIKNDFASARNTFSEVRQLFMQFVFFGLLINEILIRPFLEKKLLITFVYSMMLMTAFYILNIGVVVDSDQGRVTMFNNNSNNLALWYVFSLFIILKLLIEKQVNGATRTLFVIFIPIFIIIMAYTGSRGAFVAFLIGPTIYMLFLSRKLKHRNYKRIVGVLLLIIIGFLVSQTDVMQSRIKSQIDDPNYGGRTKIWEYTTEYIQENLVFGGGASGFEKHISGYMGKAWSPHNEYFLITAYTGLTGLFFFTIFLWRLGKAAYNGNKEHQSAVYLSFYFVFLVFFYVSGGFITSFTLWFFLAVIAVQSRKSSIISN